MPIKLLALDLDGTLVADLHTIPPRTQAAIEAATARGVRVTLATGREWPITEKFAQMLNLTTPVICYQGALICDPHTGETLVSEGVPVPLAHQLVDLARSDNLALQLYFANTAYTERLTAQSQAIFAGIGTPIVEVPDLKQNITSTPIKGLIVHPAGETETLMARLRATLNGNLSIFRSLDTLVEITSPNVSKGRALAALAGHYHLSPDEVMAIGDQDNDIDMIDWAGLGVAMGNASPGAKAAANHIAPPVSDEGAAWAIERFILDQ